MVWLWVGGFIAEIESIGVAFCLRPGHQDGNRRAVQPFLKGILADHARIREALGVNPVRSLPSGANQSFRWFSAKGILAVLEEPQIPGLMRDEDRRKNRHDPALVVNRGPLSSGQRSRGYDQRDS